MGETELSTDPHRPRHQVPLIIAGAGILVWCFASGLSAALRGRNADFNCFYDAARGVLGGTDIYTAGTGGYIYPPMLAAIMAPLGLLSLRGAAVVWTVLMAALLPAVGYLAAGNASERFASRPGRMGLWSIAALAAMVVGPELAQEFKDGNCNLLILLALVLSQRWLGKRPALCGLAAGVCDQYQVPADCVHSISDCKGAVARTGLDVRERRFLCDGVCGGFRLGAEPRVSSQRLWRTAAKWRADLAPAPGQTFIRLRGGTAFRCPALSQG